MTLPARGAALAYLLRGGRGVAPAGRAGGGGPRGSARRLFRFRLPGRAAQQRAVGRSRRVLAPLLRAVAAAAPGTASPRTEAAGAPGQQRPPRPPAAARRRRPLIWGPSVLAAPRARSHSGQAPPPPCQNKSRAARLLRRGLPAACRGAAPAGAGEGAAVGAPSRRRRGGGEPSAGHAEGRPGGQGVRAGGAQDALSCPVCHRRIRRGDLLAERRRRAAQ